MEHFNPRECIRICQIIPECQRMPQNFHECLRTPQNTQEHLKMSHNIQEYFRTSRNLWKYFTKPPELHTLPQNVQESFKITETPWGRFKMYQKTPDNQRTPNNLKWTFQNLKQRFRSLHNLRWQFWMSECSVVFYNNPEPIKMPQIAWAQKKNVTERLWPPGTFEKHENASECLWNLPTSENTLDNLGTL